MFSFILKFCSLTHTPHPTSLAKSVVFVCSLKQLFVPMCYQNVASSTWTKQSCTEYYCVLRSTDMGRYMKELRSTISLRNWCVAVKFSCSESDFQENYWITIYKKLVLSMQVYNTKFVLFQRLYFLSCRSLRSQMSRLSRCWCTRIHRGQQQAYHGQVGCSALFSPSFLHHYHSAPNTVTSFCCGACEWHFTKQEE